MSTDDVAIRFAGRTREDAHRLRSRSCRVGVTLLLLAATLAWVPAAPAGAATSQARPTTSCKRNSDGTAVPEAFFAIEAHLDFLGAYPTDNTTCNWSKDLRNGRTTRDSLLVNLANSEPWIRHVVTQFYTDTLGRTPNASEVEYWASQIRSGHWSVPAVAAFFYSSDEYFRKRGSSVSAWVRDLYIKLLERAPDSGQNYWIGQVAHRGREWVAYQFYQSNESAGQRVTLLYQELLNRTPDRAGKAYWIPRVQSRGDITLAIFVASSPEYMRQATQPYLWDISYVQHQGGVCTGRASDAINGVIYQYSLQQCGSGASSSGWYSVSYNIDRSYSKFVSTVGIRDDQPANAMCGVRIYVDGALRQSFNITLGHPVPVHLNIANGLRLELQTSCAEGGKMAYIGFGNAQLLHG